MSSAKDESVATEGGCPSVVAGLDSAVIEKKDTDGSSEKVNDIEKQQAISATEPLPSNPNWLQDGDIGALRNMLQQRTYLYRGFDIPVEFHNLAFTMKVDMERRIPTVLTMLSSMVCWWQHFQEKKTVHILANATGRIPARKMTLLIGPPGAGKSVLLQALSGRLYPAGNSSLSGDVFYGGDSIKSGKFRVSKVSDYIEQVDRHDGCLTVEETLKFAWQCTSGGSHSYAEARDEQAAEILNQEDPHFTKIHNILAVLGLLECKDTVVGNAMIRGVSGGQKRRVSVGEMLVCPRPIKFMDCISNGLDTSTAVDILTALRELTNCMGMTTLISLLQPPPDIFALFDEIILLSEGHIIYHGPRDQIMSYFENLGYTCPDHVDEADFLQELPTSEGKRYITSPNAPSTPAALAEAWQKSKLYQQMVSELSCGSQCNQPQNDAKMEKRVWEADYLEAYAGSLWYYFVVCIQRQFKMIFRNTAFVKARIGQSLLVGAIAGSVFNNISTTDFNTMNGFLFFITFSTAISNISAVPVIYGQKSVFYKQQDAGFFPTITFVVSQALAFVPLQLIESILFGTIVYWSAALSDDERGSRFLTYVLLNFIFAVCFSQIFRLISTIFADMTTALPLGGIFIVMNVLFSGFIQPKNVISDGWIWFYWICPLAWALKAVTVNEYKAPDYDFLTCTDSSCTSKQRYGDFLLDQYGNPTDEKYIWYSLAVLIGELFFLMFLTYLGLEFYRSIPTPPPPLREEDNHPIVLQQQPQAQQTQSGRNNYKKVIVGVTDEDLEANNEQQQEQQQEKTAAIPSTPQGYEAVNAKTTTDVDQLAYDPLSFAFRDISYTVTLPNGEDKQLLDHVTGYFAPGKVTALMGASGAGKTTLLDVLAGRKNTGVITGEMFLNGVPKVDAYFRKVTAYVEQFDSLPRKSTAREAIAFSAALSLSSDITSEQREKWVDSVLRMMDLEPLRNELVGVLNGGGMSFEQRKRVSIGVELASNPSIIFLDEPTTGLDSRAAQILVRNIRTIAATGRTVVCTIHQPSSAIFQSFDSLLLLKTGGKVVYFGELGERAQSLVDYFQSAPHVSPIPHHVNPATWMLEVIGAGTSNHSSEMIKIDFSEYYRSSSLCTRNLELLEDYTKPMQGSKRISTEDMEDNQGYNASYFMQFVTLMGRFGRTYYRTPLYTALRPMINILLALLFSSAYPMYSYHNNVQLISLTAVMYNTTMFCGVVALFMGVPMAFSDRDVFYKEQQSRLYSVGVYAFCMFLIEIPVLIVSSLAFTLPFFFLVGLRSPGDETTKFLWYWLFQFFIQSVCLYLGQFYAALTPNEATSQVLVGLNNTVLALFCGFLTTEAHIPDFWLFMYWLNPLHFCLEGLVSTQFYDDYTMIKTSKGAHVTTKYYLTQIQFTRWKYGHIGYDILALCLLVFGAVTCNYLCLKNFRHDKR